MNSTSAGSTVEIDRTPRHTLLLRLAGPMQSWGFRSRFDNRDTALEPTRSGVIGLLCAALGIGRDEPEKLQRFAALKMGVRVDAPGRVMVDYHTAQKFIPSSGQFENKGTTQSWRYYLADARFLVGLESDDLEELRALENALRDPVWPLFLGRKSFVASLPIHLLKSGVRENLDVKAALCGEPWYQTHAREKPPYSNDGKTLELRLLLESNDGVTMGDVPLDWKSRRFGLRTVRGEQVTGFTQEKEELCFFRV